MDLVHLLTIFCVIQLLVLFAIGFQYLRQTFISSKVTSLNSSKTFIDKNSLIKSDERYAIATETAGIGVWDWDIVTDTYSWNNQMYLLWELDKEPSMMDNVKNLLDKMFPEDREKNQNVLNLALKDKKEYRVELRLYLKDGSIRYIQSIGNVFRDKSGLPTRVIGVSIDITALKKFQESILENERLLQLAYETADMGIIKRDLRKGDVLLFNERAQTHCGVNKKEVSTREVLERIHPDDLVLLKQKMEKARLSVNDGKYTFEYRIRHDDGIYHWVAIEASYIFEGDGESRVPIQTLTTTRDITSRKNFEKEMIEKNLLLEMAYEATEMGVWKHDIVANIFYFNERCQMHHGFNKTEIPFEELTSILHPDDIVELQNAFMQAIGKEGNGKYSRQFRIIHKDKGLRWLSIDAFISAEGEIENKHPIFAVGTSRDITNQKNAELELEQYKNQLEKLVEERTNQLSASLEQIRTANDDLMQKEIEVISMNKELEAFSYSVSHNLRTPLRSIDGFSNLILKKYSELLPEEGKDYFHRVRNASQKMGVLIDDLLRLSKISQMQVHKENVDLSELALTISNDLIAQDPDRIGDFIIQPGITAFVDKTFIEVALQNLLANAWKYSRTKEKTKIEFGSFEKENTIVYFIKDNGVGFDMKYSNKLFGAFQRLHNTSEFEGTGIGLATTLRVINKLGGRIWTEAEVDKGATFYFTV